jgi:trk system potassium uptake protein TrkH
VGLYFWSTAGMLPETDRAARAAVFEAVTALTTTGFNSIPCDRWNATAIPILSILMLIAGGICSTAGGVKQLRVYVLYRAAVWEIRRLVLPRSAVSQPELWQGERRQAIGGWRSSSSWWV